MHMFKHALLLSSVLASLSMGCSNAEELVKASETYQTAVCACKDTDCVTKATTDYGNATKALADKKLTPSEAEAKKITDATTKATECVTKVTMEAAGAAAAGAAGAIPGAK